MIEQRSVRFTRSFGGASNGRNDAFRQMSDDMEYLLFPNDDTYYPDGFFAALESLLSERPDVGLFPVVSDLGCVRAGLSSWGNFEGPLARRVLTCSHEPGMLVQANIFRALCGFEATIGVGSSGIVQSGEGSEFIARVLRSGYRVADFSGGLFARESIQESGKELVRKKRKYASGGAYVVGRHRWMAGSNRALFRMIVSHSLKMSGIAVIVDMVKAYMIGVGDASRDCAEL